jgi:hypothetical protein
MSSFFSLRTKARLARSILTREHPVYVQFYVTARCNLECQQCNIIYANSDVCEVPLAGVRTIAENLERIGVSIVLLTGGEPFVRKDLPEIVGEFSRRNIHVRIQTNGLAREDAMQACIDAGANDISISLDSIDPQVQDEINGRFGGSWNKAVSAFAMVNRIFPPDSFAAMGCVLAPRNVLHIPDLVRFATAIGWYVSIVPAHTTTQRCPQNFRSFDDVCRFEPQQFPQVRQIIDEIRRMRDDGYLVYDSDEYLEDMYRLVRGERVRWRDRNEGVCDSPNLYFAILPNGRMAVCCDHRLEPAVSTMDPGFPERFFSDGLREEVHEVTAACRGCLYGSFPEITITNRFFWPMFKRTLFFNGPKQKLLKKYSHDEMLAIAAEIRSKTPSLYGALSTGADEPICQAIV